jgi:hypothetical protein
MESNHRPTVFQTVALPLSYLRNKLTVGRARLELTSSGHEPDMFPFTIPPLFIKVSRRVKAVKRAYVVCVAQVQMKEICEKLKEINFVL